MTTTLDSPAAPPGTGRLRTWHRPSLWFAAAMAVAGVASALAMLLDQRTLFGVPIWAKLFKFAVSGGLYFFTWSWLVSLLPRFRRTAGVLTNVAVVAFAGEYVLMTVQAVRGRPSHFGNASSFDSALFRTMGAMVSVLWVATLVVTVLLMFARLEDRGLHWAVRTGAVIGLIGTGLGALMIAPTRSELATIAATGHSDLLGAHTVGLPDGGPGLPLLGWSTVGGDLRIPHFIGMHALQVLPLLAFVLGSLSGRLPLLRDGKVRARLVWTGSLGYAGTVGLLLWQAERGESIVHPSGLTLVVAGVFAAVLAVATALSLVSSRRTAQ